MWNSGAQDTLLDDWVNVTANTPFTLDANTRYWMCLGNNGGSASATYRMGPAPLAASFYGADAAFFAGKGGVAVQAQIAVTNGAFPTTMPAIAAPVCLLVGTPF